MKYFIRLYFIYGNLISFSKGCALSSTLRYCISNINSFRYINMPSFLWKALMLIIFLGIPFTSISQTIDVPTIGTIQVREITSGQIGAQDTREYVGKELVMSFSVPAVTESEGAGGSDDNHFHWIVYGGTVQEVTGGSLSGAINNFSDSGNEVSILTSTGLTSGESAIKIKWQNSACSQAYIAVKQISEFNCSDDIYSIYYIKVVDGEMDYMLSMSDVSAICEGNPFPINLQMSGGISWRIEVKQTWNSDADSDTFIIDINTSTPGIIDNGGGDFEYDHLTNLLNSVPGDHTFEILDFSVIMINGGNLCEGKINSPPKTGVVNPVPNTSQIEHN